VGFGLDAVFIEVCSLGAFSQSMSCRALSSCPQTFAHLGDYCSIRPLLSFLHGFLGSMPPFLHNITGLRLV
jgi:hypothetical protein